MSPAEEIAQLCAERGVKTSDPFRLDPAVLPPVPANFAGVVLIEVLPRFRSGRGRWYRPNAQGYTDIFTEAGVFDIREARHRTDRSDRCYPVDARRALAEAWVQLDAFMGRLNSPATTEGARHE